MRAARAWRSEELHPSDVPFPLVMFTDAGRRPVVKISRVSDCRSYEGGKARVFTTVVTLALPFPAVMNLREGGHV